jgi:hypothetical protein
MFGMWVPDESVGVAPLVSVYDGHLSDRDEPEEKMTIVRTAQLTPN